MRTHSNRTFLPGFLVIIFFLTVNTFAQESHILSGDFIEVTLRGQASMDEIFDTTTEIHEIEGACEN